MTRRLSGIGVTGRLVVAASVLGACGGGGDEDAGGGSIDDWCELARELEGSDAVFDDLGADDPAAVEAAVDELQANFDRAARLAPDEILADVNTSADGVDALAKVLDDAGYDIMRIDEAAIGEIDALSAGMDAATERITAYNAAECGIEPAAAGTVPPEPVDTTAAPAGTIAPEPAETTAPRAGDPDSAWCVTARDVRAASDALDADEFDFTDPAAVESAFDELLTALDAAIGSAPPEIADSVQTSYDGFVRLRDALAAVDYDFLRADLAVIDELDAAMEDANARIEEYNESVCGIPADDTAEEGSADEEGEFDPSAGSIREQVLAELVAAGFTDDEAACIFDSIDLTDPDLAEDMGAMFEVFDQCGIDLQRLAELGG